MGGFYTGRYLSADPDGNDQMFGAEFELGLELDSAEVRGILLFNNQEWGR